MTTKVGPSNNLQQQQRKKKPSKQPPPDASAAFNRATQEAIHQASTTAGGRGTSNKIVLSTEPAVEMGNIQGGVQVTGLGLPTRQETFYTTITLANGKTAKYQIAATVPQGLNAAAVQEYWNTQLSYLAQSAADYLPDPQQTYSFLVAEDGLSVTKGAGIRTPDRTFKEDHVADACSAYVNGEAEELKEALKAEKAIIPTPSPVVNDNAPAGIQWGGNNCYLASALQSILNDPVLMSELPAAINRSSPEKKGALTILQELSKDYENAAASKSSLPREKVEALRDALNQIYRDRFKTGAQEDATELVDAIVDLILEKSDKGNHALGLKRPSASNEDMGHLRIPVLPGTNKNSVSTYVANMLFSENQSEEIKFKSPPSRLDLSFIRVAADGRKIEGPIEVDSRFDILGAQFESQSENVNYTLSSIILHTGGRADSGHYTAIVRRGDRYYHCNGATIDRGMTAEECVRYVTEKGLEGRVSKVVYTRTSLLPVVKKKPNPSRTSASAPDEAASTPHHQPETKPSSPTSEQEITLKTKDGNIWGRPRETGKSGLGGTYRPKLHAVCGDISKQPSDTHVINFTNSTLSEHSTPGLAIGNRTELLAGAAFNQGQLKPCKPALHGQYIHVRHEKNKEDLQRATLEGLKKALEHGIEHIAIPFVHFSSITQNEALDAILQAIYNFENEWRGNGAKEIVKDIKIVFSQEDIDQLTKRVEKKDPSTPGAAAANSTSSTPATAPQQDVVLVHPTKKRPKGVLSRLKESWWGDITFSMRQSTNTPKANADTYVAEIKGTDILSYEDAFRPSGVVEFYLRAAVAAALKEKKKNLILVVHQEAGAVVDPGDTEKTFTRAIENLTNGAKLVDDETSSVFYGDNNSVFSSDKQLTSIEVVVLPPLEKKQQKPH